MKKYLSIAAALALLLSVTGCSAAENTKGGIAADRNGGGYADIGAGDADAADALEKGYGYSGTDIGGSPAAEGDGMKGEAPVAPGAIGDAALMEAAPGIAGGGSEGFDYAPPGDIVEAPPVTPQIPPQAGLLTGGEWRDNDHWSDWKALYNSHSDWNGYKSDWRIKAVNRLAVKVQNEKEEPLEGAVVTVDNWMSAVTDNKGMAYLFGEGCPSSLTVSGNGDIAVNNNYSWSDGNYRDMTETITLVGSTSTISKKLDLMIMCDTTGSMADELEYLKEELADIVKKIKSDNANIPTRVSVNFYRDEGDEYVVRQFPFSENIDSVVKAIGEQSAYGGGDFPEAVHTALDSAINNHDWNGDSVKVMFLVLDAPPHSDAQIVDSVNSYVAKAAKLGIRIIPIASSGIDKSTEYLLRTMAFTTGGTYTFLTSDSGIGGEHIEPTVGAFNVEKLGDMMVRIVSGYLE